MREGEVQHFLHFLSTQKKVARSRASPNRDPVVFHFFFLGSHTAFGQPLSPRWALNVIGKRLICHLILILNIDGAYSNQRGGVLSSYTTHNCERRRRNVFHPAPLTIHNLRTASPVGHRRSTAGLDYDAHTRGTRTPGGTSRRAAGVAPGAFLRDSRASLKRAAKFNLCRIDCYRSLIRSITPGVFSCNH